MQEKVLPSEGKPESSKTQRRFQDQSQHLDITDYEEFCSDNRFCVYTDLHHNHHQSDQHHLDQVGEIVPLNN